MIKGSSDLYEVSPNTVYYMECLVIRITSGHIISDWQPLRHFCLEQLRRIWLFMRCNLQLGDEERSFLIVQAMQQLFEVCVFTAVAMYMSD